MGDSAESTETILTCGCGDTDKFAKDAYSLLFPDSPAPALVHSMGIIRDKKLRDIVNGLTKRKKYAYLLRYGDNIEVWDLIKGVRIV